MEEGAPKDGFEGFTFVRPLGGGKQKKAELTGFYIDEHGVVWVIKKSEKYEADNIAEVVASSILVGLIGEENALPYEFIKSEQGEVYIRCKVLDNYKELGNLVGRQSWLSSDPPAAAIPRIQAQFDTPQKKKDMANILAACLLIRELDCQVGNICFHDINGETRVAKLDDGWALADLCTRSNKKVNLHETVSALGFRGTHSLGGVPTNHFKDYPGITSSKEFADSLREVAEKILKNDQRLESSFVTSPFKKIEDFYENDNEGLIKAYKLLYQHLGIPESPGKKGPRRIDSMNFGDSCRAVLYMYFMERAKSMLILSDEISAKIPVDDGGPDSKEVVSVRSRTFATSFQHFVPPMQENKLDIEERPPLSEEELEFLKNIQTLFTISGEKKISVNLDIKNGEYHISFQGKIDMKKLLSLETFLIDKGVTCVVQDSHLVIDQRNQNHCKKVLKNAVQAKEKIPFKQLKKYVEGRLKALDEGKGSKPR